MHENVSLAPLTTLGVGGPARYFDDVESEAELANALALAEAYGLPLLLLGGGSNLVVADEGFCGLVVRLGLYGISVEQDGERVLVTAAAGEDWDTFVRFCVERALAGVECLAGIPGLVGATPIQNVGAYGQEVAETIVRVRAYDRVERRTVELSNAECGFGYRASRFNTTDVGRWLILSVTFALTPGGPPTLKYADLQRHFGEDAMPTLTEVYHGVRAIRARKGMVIDPTDPDSRSAGSFFKNPVVSAERFAALRERYGDEVPHYPQLDGSIKVPAAWLIEHAGFRRGQTFGNVGISTKHVLALVNRGGATAAEVVAAARRIQEGVSNTWGIHIVPEPIFVGFEGSLPALPDGASMAMSTSGWFYDNCPVEVDEESGFIGVERVYCLDWDQFTKDDWDSLESVYHQLPAWKGYEYEQSGGCPYWFGTSEEEGPYVWASVEPPGLQVVGFVPKLDWANWDVTFRRLASCLPWRQHP